MMRVKIENELRELRAEAQELAATVGDQLTDEQRSKIDKLKEQIETRSADLERLKLFEQADEQAAGVALDGAQRDWQTRCREFSITRAIAAALGRNVDDGPEREVQDELRKRSSMTYEGFPVPLEALETRAVTTTTPSGGPGSRIVADDYRPGDFIPLLRNELLSTRLGIRVLRGLQGDISIPKQSAAASVAWGGEADDFSVSDLQFATPITMSPHKVGAMGQWSQRMLLQASPDIESLVRQDLTAVLAREIDRATLFGTGSNDQPSGIYQGVTSLNAGTNGGGLTLARLHAMMLELSDDNVGMTSRAFATNMHVVLNAAETVKFSSAGSETLYEDGRLAGVPTYTSNVVPRNGTKGSGRNLSTLMYGEWSDALIGIWQELDVLVNPYALAAYQRGDVMIRVMAHLDVVKRYDESFVFHDDLTT